MCVPCFVNVECPSCHTEVFEKLSHFIQCARSASHRQFCSIVSKTMEERGLVLYCNSCSHAIRRRHYQATHVWRIQGLSPEESGCQVEAWMDRLDASEPVRALLHNVAREQAAEKKELLLQQAHMPALIPEITESIQPPEGLRCGPLDGSEDADELEAHIRRMERSWNQVNRQLQGLGTRRGRRMPREGVSLHMVHNKTIAKEQWNQWWRRWWIWWWDTWWRNNEYWLDVTGMPPNTSLQQPPFVYHPLPRLDVSNGNIIPTITRRNSL